jgi:cytochrome c peroxidase
MPRAAASPTDAQLDEIVSFQMGIFTAQIFDNKAKFLTGDNAKSGPIALSSQEFFIGINDPLGLNPKGTPVTSQVFDLYRPWSGIHRFEEFAVVLRVAQLV